MCGLVSTHAWITQSKISSITLLLAIKLTCVMKEQDLYLLGFLQCKQIRNDKLCQSRNSYQIPSKAIVCLISLSNLNYRPFYISICISIIAWSAQLFIQRLHILMFWKILYKSVIFNQIVTMLVLAFATYFVLNFLF